MAYSSRIASRASHIRRSASFSMSMIRLRPSILRSVELDMSTRKAVVTSRSRFSRLM